MFNKINDNMKDNMSNLYKKVKYEKNKLEAKLDKLDNDAKLNNYIKENNDKIMNTKNKLDNANDEYNNLLLEYNRLNEEFINIKDDLYKTKNRLNKSKDDIIEKNKKIDELEKVQETFNHQNTKMIEFESELNKK